MAIARFKARKVRILLSFCLLLSSASTFSQKADSLPLPQVNPSDFNCKGGKSICLYYKSLFSYHYSLPYNDQGAWDMYYSMHNETRVRILLNKNDTCGVFFALHMSCMSVPEITSGISYRLDHKKVASNNIRRSPGILILNYYDKGCFFDLSSLKDSSENVIVDIKFTYPVFSKKEIGIYTDSNTEYRFMSIIMDIPEIYRYDTEFDDSLFTRKIRKSLSGAIIGYYFYKDTPGPLPKTIISKFNADRLSPQIPKSPVRFITTPCYCTNYINSFTSRKPIAPGSNDKECNFPALIKLHLKSIGEIMADFSVRYKTFR
jgi:hypothetical protein